MKFRVLVYLLIPFLIGIGSFTQTTGSGSYDFPGLVRLEGALIIDGMESDLEAIPNIQGDGTLETPYIVEYLFINNTSTPGIRINNSSIHIIIKDVVVFNNIWNRTDGIMISNSSNVTIVDSMVQGCYIGLHVDSSSEVHAIGCDLSGNRYGIVVRNGPDVRITDCSAHGNMVDGIWIDRSDRCTISYCQLVSNSARISNDAAIRITESSEPLIQGCELTMNYGTGIHFEGPISGGTIFDCDINYNNEAIIVEEGSNIRIQGIEMIINMKAMILLDTHSSIIADCWAYRNDYGLSLDNVDGCSIQRIKMEECGFGFQLDLSSDNLLVDNIFIGSKEFDLHLGKDDNSLEDTSDNVMFGNIFGNRSKAYPFVINDGSNNVFDHDGKGNTWTGFILIDEDEDGIGDEPYRVQGTGGAYDRFPETDLIPEEPTFKSEALADRERGSAELLVLFISSLTVILIICLVILRVSKKRSVG